MKENTLNEIKDAVVERFGSGYTVTMQDVTKNNGLKLCGLTICKSGEVMNPIIYIDGYAEDVESGKSTPSEVARVLADIYEQNARGVKPVEIGGKQGILDRTIYRVVNTERNGGGELAAMPHREYLDLSVTYRMLFDLGNGQEGTAPVTDAICEAYSITQDELEEAARRNTLSKGFISRGMAEIMAELTGLPAEMFGEEDPTMRIFTNESKMFGASVLLFPDEFREMADEFGCDLYVMPSSVHEVIAVPETMGPQSMVKAMVPEVNASEVAEDEVLSDNVYRYVREAGRLEVME